MNLEEIGVLARGLVWGQGSGAGGWNRVGTPGVAKALLWIGTADVWARHASPWL